MNHTWEVIVVGAGPGGATAAYGLAKAGLHVLLLEKERIPRYKPCGGGLTLKVRSTLDFDFTPALEDTIRRASVAFGKERMRMDIPGAWCVMRPKFDALLDERAVDAGAVLRDHEPVSAVSFDAGGATVTTSHGTERARFVIGADGVNGIVRRTAGFPPHTRMGAALEAEMGVSTAALEEWRGVLHLDFGALAWGYGWIFPKAEHLSIGVGNLFRPGDRQDLRAVLARYIASEPTLRGGTSQLTRGHRVPLGGAYARYHAPRALLVGDAAGVVDPFTAEGIYYAIRSGQMAAEEIGRAAADGNWDLSAYTRRVNREINADLRYGWLLTQVFYRIPYFAYRIFGANPAVRGAIAELVSGRLTYRQTLWTVFRTMPGTMLRLGASIYR